MVASARRPMVWGVLVLLGCGFGLAAELFQEAPSAPANPTPQEQLLRTGKKLFVERCGRCHDERGDKALASGPPLNERKLTREGIERAVNSRLRDKTEEERRAVVTYIESFLKTKPSAPAVLTTEEIAQFR